MRRIASAALCAALLGAAAQYTQTAPTVPAIDARDLLARLEAFSHDSMLGRRTGTRGHARSVEYIASELTRLGVAARGDSGSYFQTVPLRRVQLDLGSAVFLPDEASAEDRAERRMNDSTMSGQYGPPRDSLFSIARRLAFLPVTDAFGFSMPQRVELGKAWPLQIVGGGRLGGPDVVTPRDARAKVVFFMPPVRPNGQPDYQLWAVRDQLARYDSAAMIIVATLDLMPQAFIERLIAPRFELTQRHAEVPRLPPVFAVSYGTVRLTVVEKDHPQNRVTRAAYTTRDLPMEPARNVVAVIEGSDPALKSEFVLLSAHADHLGVASARDRIGTDSVFNGADDGGSGSVALIEIAEHFAAQPTKPKRSILFVWTVGEEDGFLGAEFFADNPTVSRDRIVASVTVDLIGRGTQRPVPAEFAANPARAALCAGDEWHFQRWGIPAMRVAGAARDEHHTVADQMERIDGDRYAIAVRDIAALIENVANASNPPPKGDRSNTRRACAR